MIQDPSAQQLDIFDAILNTNHNIVVSATAGAGKTTTIVTAAKLLPASLTSTFLAFNKSIVETLKTKLPSNVVCKTAHSYGLSALSDYYKMSFKLNEYKSLRFIAERLKEKPNLTDKQKNTLQYALMDIIRLIRMDLTPYDVESIATLCNHYSVYIDEPEILDCIEILHKIDYYNKSFSKKNNQIDFTEMIYLSATNPKIRLPFYDMVFVDECQDFNKAQQLLVEKILKPRTGRLVTIGDKNQSLYSFAGADGNAFQYFKNRSNTISLPLTTSYRCCKAIVRHAREVYPDIEIYEKNEEGEVRDGSVGEIQNNDMVICRNNRPLIELYFQLLESGQPATIIGRDIEVGINKVLSKVIDYDVKEGLKKLDDNLFKLKAELKLKGVKNTMNHPKVINLYEQNRVLEVLSRGLDHFSQVEDRLKEMFMEGKKDAVRLMTVHGSKGLENDRVFLIEFFEGKRLIPSPYALQEWEKIQEQNILFVAFTRAKKSLIKIKL